MGHENHFYGRCILWAVRKEHGYAYFSQRIKLKRCNPSKKADHADCSNEHQVILSWIFLSFYSIFNSFLVSRIKKQIWKGFYFIFILLLFLNRLDSLYFSCIKLCGDYSWSMGPLYRNSDVGPYKMVSEFLIGRLSKHSLSTNPLLDRLQIGSERLSDLNE